MNAVAKRTVAIRVIKPFNIITQTGSKQLQSLKSALTTCALRADGVTLKSHSDASAFMAFDKAENLFRTAEQGFSEAALIDRSLENGDETESTRCSLK